MTDIFSNDLNSGKSPDAAITLPGLSAKQKDPNNVYKGYRVKILKANLDDVSESLLATSILTQSLDGTNRIVLIDKTTYSFQSSFFIVLTYLEKSLNA